jgi:cell division protein FtsW
MTAASLQYSRSIGRPARLVVDPLLVSATLALLLIGLVMVTSASMSVADRAMGSPFAYLERQLLFALVGTMCGIIAFSVPSSLWQRLSMPLLLIGLALLVLVLLPGIGHEVNGSRRWLRLGMLNFQASELARLLILIYIASYAVRHQAELRESLVGVLKPLGLLVLAAFLLLLEPDFGAASVLLVTGFAVLFVAGMPWKYVIVVLGAGGLALGAAAVSSAYRVQRLTTFLDPWADPFNSGFQLTQSLIAIGRGEWFGVGLGASVQKLFYLPEAHTDFVFAVMAEEFGLAGVIVVLGLFALLVLRVCRIAQRAALAGEMFQAYLAAAFAIWVGLQAFINIGVNMGMLPTKGLTLPLMSYGRSSLLVTLAWLGIVLRIHHESAAAGRLAVPRQDQKG